MSERNLNDISNNESWSDSVKLIRMDALPNIVRSKNWIAKVAWLVLFIASVSICLWLIIGSIREYLKFEVATATRRQQEQSSVFPTLNICLINPLTTNYSVNYMKQTNRTVLDASAASIYTMEAYAVNVTGPPMTASQLAALTNMSAMLVSCTIGNITCTASQFQWMWHPWYFGCYRFNSGFDSANNEQPLITTDMGSSISIELYAGLPNYWAPLARSGVRGFYVFIKNATDYPNNLTPSPSYAMPGFGVSYGIQRSFYSQFNEWPYAYSECRVGERGELIGPPLDDPELFEQVIATNFSYSRTTCITFCAQLFIAPLCECNYFNIDWHLPGYGLCLNTTQYVCAHNFWFNNFTTGTFITDNCLSKCPLECHQSTIKPTVSFYPYPTGNDVTRVANMSAMYKAHSTEDDFMLDLSQNLVKIEMHYDSLAYDKTNEKEAISFDDLLGTLGGHLHLFLGMSLMSFVEIMELIMLATTSTFHRDDRSTNPTKH